MLLALTQLRSLCSAQDVRRLWALLGVVIATGVLEVAGIASVLPFLQMASDPQAALTSPWLRQVVDTFGFTSHQNLLLATGCAVILFLTVSNCLAALASWLRQRIAWTIAHSVSIRLAHAYTRLPYRFFLNRDSADLIKSVIDDVNNLVDGVVIASCQLLSQLIMAGMILTLLAIVNPAVAISAFALFVGIYLLIFLLRRRYLTDLGRQRLAANSQRYVTFSDLMLGIKAVKSDGASDFFVGRFEKPSARFSQLQPLIHLSMTLPRYIVETVAFGAIIGVVLVLSDDDQIFVQTLPTVTLFALAGYRLMPAVNTAYVSMAQILSSYPAIENIHRDIHAAPPALSAEQQASPTFSRSIELRDIGFRYTAADRPVLQALSLTIPKGRKVALVGPSGSGKTTLIDILTGMLVPGQGSILIDGAPINEANTTGWQKLIGYVPQEVYLYNDTIERNIAFGSEPLDQEKVREACRIAQISETIETEMPAAYQTLVGEQGVRLSGGQRQRLGLARALYRSPQVLVLDEATSALDSKTEGKVMAAIYDELPSVTIVMIAHRISTVRRCDWLYAMDRGQLVAQGTYADLLASDNLFRDLAKFD